MGNKLTTMKRETRLSFELLEKLYFNKRDHGFEDLIDMHHFVKKGVFLFYNTPVQLGSEDSFMIGYGEMRRGKYHIVTFRWIHNLGELTDVYESVTGSKVENPIN